MSCNRSVQRRVHRACSVDAMVEDCIQALNSLYSGESIQPAMSDGPWSAAQTQMIAHIRASVDALGPCPEGLDGKGAVSQLHAFDGYGEDQCPAAVASYNPELLSLPSAGNRAVPVAELLGDDGMEIVSAFCRTRLLDENEARRNLVDSGVQRCYTDPRLRNPSTYQSFVRRLSDAGLVQYSAKPGTEQIEMFCVSKKDGRQRLVVDCRKANCWFAAPDKVRLTTAEALSRIQLPSGGPLYVSTADLKDAFYHFELPAELRRFFTMRPVHAGSVGVKAIDGVAVSPSCKIFPQLRVLPMGWSHALWWCQMIHQRIVSEIGATAENSIEDKAIVPEDDCMHLEYVDNWVVLGTNKDKVEKLAQRGVDVLRQKGLVVHEVEQASSHIKVLGWEFEGSTFRPRPLRVWRVRKAFEHLLSRGVCSGRQLEKIVGHANFLSLGRREALSIFGETYTFIQRHYHHSSRIWRSVRKELSIFIGIAPLIWRDLSAPWDNTVTSVDASDWGMGATTTVFDPDEVAELGKFSERWRFDYKHLSKPREHSFGLAAVSDPQDSGGAAWAATEAMVGSGLEPLKIVPPKTSEQIFKPVAFSVVNRSWKVCGRYKWKRSEPIPVLEARASLFAIRHAVRSVDCFGKRLLVLSDSISAVCALDKGRGRSFKMRRVSQQVAAISLGANLQVCYRWIPSEWNPADGPSRGSFFPSKPVRCPLPHDPPVFGSGESGPCKKGSSMQHQEEQGTCFTQESQGSGVEAEEEKKTTGRRWDSGRSVSVNQVQGGLQGLLGQIDSVQQSPFESQHSPSTSRPMPGRHAQPHVQGGGGPQYGSIHGGSNCVPPPAPQGTPADAAPKSKTVTTGLAEIRPSKVTAAFAMGNSGAHDPVCYEKQPCPRSIDDGNVLLPVPQARGSLQTSKKGFGASSQDQVFSEPNLERGVASNRIGGGVQDLRVRRDSDLRRQGDVPHSSCSEQVATLTERTKKSATVYINIGAAERGDGESGKSRESGSRWPSSSISVAAWRSKPRLCPEEEETRRDPTPRTMEDLFQRPPVRKGWKAQPAPTRAPGLRIAEMHPGRRQHRENTPMPALTVGRALTVAVFLEIFSGVGNLSHSMASICQCYVLMWDITLGAEYDLRSPAKRRLIADWIRSGFILGFHLGTPCESFTRARDVRPGPPPLRSDSQPLGLPAAQLKPHDQVKVALGNLWMRFSVWLLTLGLRFQVRGTMENPARSRLWLCPPVQYLLRRNLVTWVETHYCAWGKPYKKPTGFLCVILTLPRLQHAVCQSGKRGICQYTLCKHMQLVGQNSQGQWLTNVAQPYPKKMCTAYAKDFYDHDVQTIARNFTSKLGTR